MQVNKQGRNVRQPRVPDFSLHLWSTYQDHMQCTLVDPGWTYLLAFCFSPLKPLYCDTAGLIVDARHYCSVDATCNNDNCSESWHKTSAACSKQERVIMWGDRIASENVQKGKPVPLYANKKVCGGSGGITPRI